VKHLTSFRVVPVKDTASSKSLSFNEIATGAAAAGVKIIMQSGNRTLPPIMHSHTTTTTHLYLSEHFAQDKCAKSKKKNWTCS